MSAPGFRRRRQRTPFAVACISIGCLLYIAAFGYLATIIVVGIVHLVRWLA